MSLEKFDNEKEIRRFLLGEMGESERAAFEERFIAEDGVLFEQIAVVEDELIETYVCGALETEEKTKFERAFLTTETRRNRVEFTREMLAQLAVSQKTPVKAANTTIWDFIEKLFKTPSLAFGVAFAALLLVFAFWFLIFRNPEKRNDIALQTTPTPVAQSPTPTLPENNQNSPVDSNVTAINTAPVNKSPSVNTNAENSTKNLPQNAILKPVVATIALFAGTSRAEGKTSELNLTKETSGARFQLNLENQDYKIYRAEIVDADGNVISQSGRLIARRSRIDAFFPTAKLKRGDYMVKLYGFNPYGAEESAADFQFRVVQK